MLQHLGRGVLWTYASMGISGILQLAVVAVTARLLPAEAFGLIAMANVVLRFSSYFANMGVGRALIQRHHIDDDDIRAATTSSTVLGFATATAVMAIAPLAAEYYQDVDVVAIMRWLALTFVFTGLGATSRALLQRRLQFRASGTVEVVSYAVGYAIPTLALATTGFGVWSLVAGAIGQAAVAAAITMALAPHSWRPMLHWAPHARLLRFGATVSGISVLEFLGSTLDTLVIGRFGTAAQVGLYNRAFMLASLPTYQANQGIAKVMFPVLSAGRHDPAAFAKALETATKAAIRLVLPLGIGMALTARELVKVALGSAWTDAIPLVEVLAPALALSMLVTFPGQALDAVGRLGWKAAMQGAYVAVLTIGLFAMGSASSDLDLHRVTIVVAVGIAVRTVGMFVVAAGIGVVPRSFITSTLSIALQASMLTFAALAGSLWLLRRVGARDEVTLAVSVGLGALVVLILLREDVVRLFRERDHTREKVLR